MTEYIIAALFSLAAIIIMAVSLHFSKYKKRKSGGCGCRAASR